MINSKETRVVAYTCTYSIGSLILNLATATDYNIGINCPLEHLYMQATTLVSLLFIYMIQLQIFPYTCLFTFLKHNNYGWIICTYSQSVPPEKMASAPLIN